MTSEIRVNKINNRSGLGTVTYSGTGIIVSGIVTANSFSGPFTGDLDVDGHTNLDNVSVAGVTTFASSIHVADSIIHEGDTDTKIDFVSNVVKITAGNKLRIDTGTSNYTTIYGSTNFTPTSSLPKGSGGYVARFRDEEGDDTIVRFHNTNIKNTVLQWSDYGSSSSAGNLVFQGFINGVEGGRFDGSGNFKLNQDLDVDGHTNLDNVSIAGVTTITGTLGSGDITITSNQPKLSLTDSSNNPDWSVKNANGNFAINDETASATRFSINSSNGVEFHMHAVPAADSTHDLGLTGTRWRNVYADTYYGNGANLTGINTDLVSDTSPQLGGSLDVNGNNISFIDSTGVNNNRATFGTGNDLAIYHDGHSRLNNSNGTLVLQSDAISLTNNAGNSNRISAHSSGEVKLYHSDSVKLETTSVGNRLYGRTDIGDSTGGSTDDRLAFGDSQDLQIYHDGSHSYIDNNTGSLRIRDAGGAEKLRVSGSGVSVTGNITVTGTVDGIDIATDVAANTAKVTNATHTGEVTGATALTIADNVVDEANLKVSNSPTNGYFLSAQSGNTGGLTWAAVDLTALSASNLTSGTIPDARFPATLPAISGANLTGVASTTAGGAIYENSQTISTTHTIPVGSNGMSAGPVTVNNGITLTISNGSTYTIV